MVLSLTLTAAAACQSGDSGKAALSSPTMQPMQTQLTQAQPTSTLATSPTISANPTVSPSSQQNPTSAPTPSLTSTPTPPAAPQVRTEGRDIVVQLTTSLGTTVDVVVQHIRGPMNHRPLTGLGEEPRLVFKI